MESGHNPNTPYQAPITLHHLDAVAHTFGMPDSYLFIPHNSTPEERVLLAMLEVGE